MEPRKDVYLASKTITSYFEGWLAGNFDKMGMSYGFLQWNFGSGTLQPLFLRLFNEFPDVCRILPSNGEWLKLAIDQDRAVEWALQIQDTSYRIREPWLSALRELYWTDAWQQIMEDAAEDYKNIAVRMCTAFNMRHWIDFCMAFDIAVQLGGLGYYEMLETTPEDKRQSWIEACVDRTTGTIDGSNALCKQDVRNRKTAIKIWGPYGNKGWPEGAEFRDEDAFEIPQDAVEPIWTDWKTVLSLAAEETVAWEKGIIAITNMATANTDTGDLEIFQYLPLLIEKIFNFREGTQLAWEEVISKVTDSKDKWVNGVNAIFKMAAADSDIGDLEIFQWLPNLLIKIYSYEK